MKKRILIVLILFVISIVSILGIKQLINVVIRQEKQEIGVENIGQQTAETDEILNEWDISETEVDNVTATLYSNGKMIISGAGNMKDYINWGIYINYITEIEIQEGITNIGVQAFSKCTKLTDVSIATTVKDLEWWAFTNTSIEIINIPKGVENIYNAFHLCSTLKEINVDSQNQNYSSVDGVLFNKDQTELVWYPTQKEGNSYNMPTTVTKIGEMAFTSNSNLINVIMPDSVEEISDQAFSYCKNLESVTFSNALTKIGRESFYECYKLTQITIPKSVTEIAGDAFYKCTGITELVLEDGNLNYISVDGIIYNKDITDIIYYPLVLSQTSYIIPETIESINRYTFWKCNNLNEITIPASVTSVSDNVFGDCNNLQYINVNEANTKYMSNNGVLYNKEKTEIVCYPKGHLQTKYVIPEGVMSLKREIFNGIINLKEIVVPLSIVNIYDDTFDEIYDLNIYCNENSEIYYYVLSQNKNVKKEIDKKVNEIENNSNDQIRYSVVNEPEYIGDGYYEIYVRELYKEEGEIIDHIETYRCNNYLMAIVDDKYPIIDEIVGNPTEWTEDDVTLTINATDNESGLAEEAYSFDGGVTWQAENTKTYTENTSEIIIQVKDNVGNVATAETIDITKIRRLNNIEIETMPNKTTYDVGDTLDKNGLTLKLIYSNGNTEIITDRFTITPNTLNIVGTQEITVTYQNKTTSFNVIVNDKIETPTITLTSDKYSIENYMIRKIQPRTIGTIFKQSIETNATSIKFNSNGIELEETQKLGTGMKLLLEDKTSYTLVITGDCNGDGEADLKDILAINKHRLNKTSLDSEYLLSGDINEDEKVDIRDILQINKYRLEKINEL